VRVRGVPFAGDEEAVETFVRLQREGAAGHSGGFHFATFHEVGSTLPSPWPKRAKVITSLPRAIHLTA